MRGRQTEIIHVLEFGCEAPLRFYEHCVSCARFDSCPELALGKEILGRRKRVSYDGNPVSEDIIHAKSFNCSAPLDYFEKSRKKCAHEGRCREEGLLLALLSGKKKLSYQQKTATELHRPLMTHQKDAQPQESKIKQAG